MIEVKHLTKKYGDKTAVDDVSFKIRNGRICGIFGVDGSGKTTLMNMLSGCLSASLGEVNVNGYDTVKEPLKARALIGYLPCEAPLYDDMTVAEYLTFIAEAKKVPYEKLFLQVRSVTEQTGISKLQGKLISKLPPHIRRKIGIAQAMLGNPEVIILDEPTAALEPSQVIEIREIIRSLGEKKTIIMASNSLSEITAVCDRVITLSDGKIISDEDVPTLEDSKEE